MGNTEPKVSNAEKPQRFRILVLLLFVATLQLILILWLLWSWPSDTNLLDEINKRSVPSNGIGSDLIQDDAITFDKINPLVWDEVKGFLMLTMNNFTTNNAFTDSPLTNISNTTTVTNVVGGSFVRPNQIPTAGDIGGSYLTGLTILPDTVTLGEDTIGDYVASITAGDGLTGGGSGEGLSTTLSVNAGDGITTSGGVVAALLRSGGGLLFDSGALSLLTSCSDGQLLKWSSIGSDWSCANDTSGGSLTVSETDGTPFITPVSQLEFGPVAASSDEFVITDQGGGVARIRLGDAVPLSNQTETITSAWTFSSEIAASGGLACTNCVALGSETTGDYLAGLLSGGGISVTGSGGEGASPTVALDSSLAIFKTFAADTGSAIADSLTDTISFIGGDGIATTGADAPDTMTLDIELASGSGLAFSGGALTLASCSDGEILKNASGSWVCAADDNTPVTAYQQHLSGEDNRTLGASLTPLLTNGSGTAQSLPITITSGNEVSFIATVEVTSTVATGTINYVVIRDDNGDDDCVTGGGDGTQIGGQVSSFLGSLTGGLTTSFSFVDTAPGSTTPNYQLCASTSIALGTTSATDRSLRLEETGL